MEFAIFVIVAGVIVLYLLGSANNSNSNSNAIRNDSFIQKKHLELLESLNRAEQKKQEELRRAQNFLEDKIRAKNQEKSFVTKNVANKVKNPLDWFVVEKAQKSISEAEKLIVAELNKYKVDWYREVAFEGLKFTNYGYARYDFLLVTPKGIHLIEYDGRSSHCTTEQKERDTIKDKFCSTNNIPLTRYNRKHYYHLSSELAKLMAQYSIHKKSN